MSERFCVNAIVLVYANDCTVQDIMFTDQSITPIAFYKGRFKATSTFLYTENFQLNYLLVLACPLHYFQSISFKWGIVGKMGLSIIN